MAKGIDVSNNQGFIDWKKVAASGVQFAFLKASEGLSFDDPRFDSYRQRANEKGIRVGAYHFARPDHNRAVAEAHHFARRINHFDRRDIKPVLDFERECTLSPRQKTEWARSFNQSFHDLLGVYPLFYSYSYYIKGMDIATPIGSGLWLADYGKNDGKEHTAVTPFPWKKTLIHQYTSKGACPGIKGYVDLNYTPRIRSILVNPIKGLL